MGIYLRNHTQPDSDSSGPLAIAVDVWDLDVQFALLRDWFASNPDFDFANGTWVVDIGYEPRGGATVAGYTLDVSLMRTLVEKDITLWLSDYHNEGPLPNPTFQRTATPPLN